MTSEEKTQILLGLHEVASRASGLLFSVADVAAVEFGVRGGTPIGAENYSLAKLILAEGQV